MNPGTARIIDSRGVKLPGGAKAKKRSKYRNEPTIYDGIRFASKREAARYLGLKAAQAYGKIENLKLQTEFAIEINGQLVCKYRADFDYYDCESGAWIVEDAKGFRTKEYQLKKKLMRAVLGIEIREV